MSEKNKGLVVECEAFLSGHFADYLSNASEPLPAWVWLNGLAHGSLEDVKAAGRLTPARDPAGLISRLAREVVRRVESGSSELATLQRQTLIPLEIRMAKRSPQCIPADWDDLALAINLALDSGITPLPKPRGSHHA